MTWLKLVGEKAVFLTPDYHMLIVCNARNNVFRTFTGEIVAVCMEHFTAVNIITLFITVVNLLSKIGLFRTILLTEMRTI